MQMQPLKAHVKNGRLVLDDPSTDLPEGSEVELTLVTGEFDPDERARLIEAVEQGAAANQLLARREAASR